MITEESQVSRAARAKAEAERKRKAEAEAKARTFDAAVRSLEESTKALQRAIRSAGIYIPG